MNIHGEVPRPVRETAADAENGYRSPDPPCYHLFLKAWQFQCPAPDPFLAECDEDRSLMALRKFVIPKRPRKQPSRKTQGAPPPSCSASQRNLLSGRRTPLAEGGDDVL